MEILSVLAEPWFVLPWYLIGLAAFIYVAYDVARINTPLKPAMRWAWPIIVFFFSVIGLVLYLATARAPGIGRMSQEEKKQAHNDYEKSTFRRVNGAVIHCVAGDGLGIMSAMVIARATGMSFWQEFWFEYLVGFLFGWLIFQYKSMTMMADSVPKALWMSFRSEFMSMLTVMGGMGAVMGFVTPLVVTEQPKPLTYAFWGFGMFGLLVGYLFTWPMNWLLVKIGWKHGMGDMKTGHQKQVKTSGQRYAAFATMTALGIVAMLLPAWLFELRDGMPVKGYATQPTTAQPLAAALADGLHDSVEAGARNLERGEQSDAMHAIDAAKRAARVASELAPDRFAEVERRIHEARHALHMGRPQTAQAALTRAAALLQSPANFNEQAMASAPIHEGILIDAHGVKIGEIEKNGEEGLLLFYGGARNVFGFLDLSAARTEHVDADKIVMEREKTLGNSLALISELP